ncbi:MAG: NAD-dependent epimerase/dehydratase family protein [Candidatus Eisenbacteria bacterium]|nr:NAD-dependent epimerase/dehydratase family protein [Candidatus Latescibacterota bacterium]MBD3302292.1 NAD-dependent epimerase/dehydratase family protein [Candidatus Eisenbacteria bacterium]
MGKTLVTGAAGFIGSHLSRRLLEEGEEVVGVDCFTDFYDPALKRRNAQELLHLPGFVLREIDLRTAPLDDLVASCDAIFHQAAQAGVRSSWGSMFADYSSINVEATQRLLEACRPHRERLRRFVYASSSSVYGDAPRYPTREEDPTVPVSPYGVTKLAGELLVRLYASQHGLPATSLRYFTVYGPRQRPDMGFHRFLRAIHTGEEIVVYGDGNQTRDFTFVSDAVDANLLALRSTGEPGETFNIGGGERIAVRDVLGLMEEVTGRTARIRHEPRAAGDVLHTGAETSRARDRLGFRPVVPLREGVARMNEWMIRYLRGESE